MKSCGQQGFLVLVYVSRLELFSLERLAGWSLLNHAGKGSLSIRGKKQKNKQKNLLNFFDFSFLARIYSTNISYVLTLC